MKLKTLLLSFFISLVSILSYAQERVISGQVTSVTDKTGIPGISVIIKDTDLGTATSLDGNFKLTIPEGTSVLVFSGIGYITKEVNIGSRSIVDVVLEEDIDQLEEVVVTALGTTREKRAVGYAVQTVDGESLATVKADNVVKSLAGKVAGVQVRSSSNVGGGSSIIIRGNSSLSGNNQPLFVVDGIPVSNNYSAGGAFGGRDYGNGAADINPDDIENMTVLKGASATALYGSRGANGVIIITTKSGQKTKGWGVSVNTGVTFSKINEATLPNYQNEYGGGYSQEFETFTFDPSIHPAEWAQFDGDLIAAYGDDASWGPKLDGTLVRHWDSWDPTDTDNFGKLRPWSPTENGIEHLFSTGVIYNNNVSLSKAGEFGNFRVSFTNYDLTGTLPNSNQVRNTLNINSTVKLTDKLSSTVLANYVQTETIGRPGTGYAAADGNAIMASFGLWHQRQLDLSRMEQYQNANGVQRTWNMHNPNYYGPNTDVPVYAASYWDNPYWTRQKNYVNDYKDRFYGKWEATLEVKDWLKFVGRVAMDYYNEERENRTAKGGVVEFVDRGLYPAYGRSMRSNLEVNYEAFAMINKDITSDLNFSAQIGANRRTERWTYMGLSTSQGLVLDDLYSIGNTANDNVGFGENYIPKEVQAVFGVFSFGYKNMIYLESSLRNEWASTLPASHSFFYPSTSASFVFSELPFLSDSRVLSFGKIRAGISKVGNAPGAFLLGNYYYPGSKYDSELPTYYPSSILTSPDLLPEVTVEREVGLELSFLENRISLDAAYYNKLSSDQFVNQPIPGSSGNYRSFGNGGEIEVKGFELMINATPIRTEAFSWNIGVNFEKSQSTVITIAEGTESLTIGSIYDVSLVHRPGMPYGSIVGTDYVYNDKGEKMIGDDGYYLISDPKVIGDINPDWVAGFTNTFTYKGLSLSAVFDMRQGGELFSQTHRWGVSNGLLEETVGNNDLGNPVRNPVTEDNTSGGVILNGVLEDGSQNTTRVAMNYNGAAADYHNPESASVFDAGYIKLRDVSLAYQLPNKITEKWGIRNLTLTATGRNLAILKRDSPHIDPELTYGVGNFQGMEIGFLPTERSYGFNLKFDF
ncbi:SusC/RagA family TonB-linked outer membrane protein [Sediminitomix flava]|uniref:TonB-linked SusC/RagA family outer membrane protein n=1 Tax=Sediminitomix flava TaxID=379075 RepID=A0A315Z6Y3_SEDFL|nr:SusC/RagA family TonB-linked outer membrane protein [Sediminitomix flava]PWJ40198.1 TonB-linked SusC/RagA family outer membrane protein [Sediminitomix flava]